MTRLKTHIDRSTSTLQKTNGETAYSITVDTTNKTTFEAIQALARVLRDKDNEKPTLGTIYFEDGSTEDIVSYVHCKLDDTCEFTSRTGMRYEYIEEEDDLSTLKTPNHLYLPFRRNYKFVHCHNKTVAPIDHIEIDTRCER